MPKAKGGRAKLRTVASRAVGGGLRCPPHDSSNTTIAAVAAAARRASAHSTPGETKDDADNNHQSLPKYSELVPNTKVFELLKKSPRIGETPLHAMLGGDGFNAEAEAPSESDIKARVSGGTGSLDTRVLSIISIPPVGESAEVQREAIWTLHHLKSAIASVAPAPLQGKLHLIFSVLVHRYIRMRESPATDEDRARYDKLNGSTASGDAETGTSAKEREERERAEAEAKEKERKERERAEREKRERAEREKRERAEREEREREEAEAKEREEAEAKERERKEREERERVERERVEREREEREREEREREERERKERERAERERAEREKREEAEAKERERKEAEAKKRKGRGRLETTRGGLVRGFGEGKRLKFLFQEALGQMVKVAGESVVEKSDVVPVVEEVLTKMLGRPVDLWEEYITNRRRIGGKYGHWAVKVLFGGRKSPLGSLMCATVLTLARSGVSRAQILCDLLVIFKALTEKRLVQLKSGKVFADVQKLFLLDMEGLTEYGETEVSPMKVAQKYGSCLEGLFATEEVQCALEAQQRDGTVGERGMMFSLLLGVPVVQAMLPLVCTRKGTLTTMGYAPSEADLMMRWFLQQTFVVPAIMAAILLKKDGPPRMEMGVSLGEFLHTYDGTYTTADVLHRLVEKFAASSTTFASASKLFATFTIFAGISLTRVSAPPSLVLEPDTTPQARKAAATFTRDYEMMLKEFRASETCIGPFEVCGIHIPKWKRWIKNRGEGKKVVVGIKRAASQNTGRGGKRVRAR